MSRRVRVALNGNVIFDTGWSPRLELEVDVTRDVARSFGGGERVDSGEDVVINLLGIVPPSLTPPWRTTWGEVQETQVRTWLGEQRAALEPKPQRRKRPQVPPPPKPRDLLIPGFDGE